MSIGGKLNKNQWIMVGVGGGILFFLLGACRGGCATYSVMHTGPQTVTTFR